MEGEKKVLEGKKCLFCQEYNVPNNCVCDHCGEINFSEVGDYSVEVKGDRMIVVQANIAGKVSQAIE